MSSYRFEIDAEGVKKNILQADWMKSFIGSQAQQQAEGKYFRTFIGFDRAKAIVYEKRRKGKNDRKNS